MRKHCASYSLHSSVVEQGAGHAQPSQASQDCPSVAPAVRIWVHGERGHGSPLPRVKDAHCAVRANGQHGVAVRLQCAAQRGRTSPGQAPVVPPAASCSCRSPAQPVRTLPHFPGSLWGAGTRHALYPGGTCLLASQTVSARL